MTSTNPMRDESRRTDPPRDVPGLNTYRVQGDSPLLPFPFVADVVASSERAAISRCRGTAFHVYRSPAVFDWDWSVLTVNTGINFDLGES